MTGKVNITVEMLQEHDIKIELWDVDLIVDDMIQTKKVNRSGLVEFIFSLSETGEFNPELQIRIFNNQNEEIYRSPIDRSLSSLQIDNVTGFMELTTVDFGTIKI